MEKKISWPMIGLAGVAVVAIAVVEHSVVSAVSGIFSRSPATLPRSARDGQVNVYVYANGQAHEPVVIVPQPTVQSAAGQRYMDEAGSVREAPPPSLVRPDDLSETRGGKQDKFSLQPHRTNRPGLWRAAYYSEPEEEPLRALRAPRTIRVTSQLASIPPEVREEIQRGQIVTYFILHERQGGCVELYGHPTDRPAKSQEAEYLQQICDGDEGDVPRLRDVTMMRATYQNQATLRVFFCPATDNGYFRSVHIRQAETHIDPNAPCGYEKSSD